MLLSLPLLDPNWSGLDNHPGRGTEAPSQGPTDQGPHVLLKPSH